VDVQVWIVVAIVAAAAFFVGRRVYATLRSFTKAGAASAGCSSGCGSCAPASAPESQPKLVSIGRARR
jgi:hypothetical protein